MYYVDSRTISKFPASLLKDICRKTLCLIRLLTVLTRVNTKRRAESLKKCTTKRGFDAGKSSLLIFSLWSQAAP